MATKYPETIGEWIDCCLESFQYLLYRLRTREPSRKELMKQNNLLTESLVKAHNIIALYEQKSGESLTLEQLQSFYKPKDLP